MTRPAIASIIAAIITGTTRGHGRAAVCCGKCPTTEGTTRGHGRARSSSVCIPAADPGEACHPRETQPHTKMKKKKGDKK